jgi:phosphoglycolate phosphatase
VRQGLIFDLDGTLWDATESTAAAWTEVFGRYELNMPVHSDQIRSVAGKPYLECLAEVCPGALKLDSSEGLLSDLLVAERKWLGILGGRLYPSVHEALRLARSNLPCFLVSNCAEWYLQAFFDRFGMSAIFSDALCHGYNGLRKSKNIELIMKRFDIATGYYIGDTQGDYDSADEAGTHFIYFKKGFGELSSGRPWATLQDYKYCSVRRLQM